MLHATMDRSRLAVVLLLAACSQPQRSGIPEGEPARGAHPSIAIAEDLRDRGAVLPHVSSPDAAVRARAARALGRIGGAQAREPLGRLAADSDPWVVAEALFDLGLVGPGEAAEAVRARLTYPSAPVRAAAVEALGRCDDDRWAPACAELLGDPDPAVQAEAFLALGRLLGERFAGRRTLGSEAVGEAIETISNTHHRGPGPEPLWTRAYALASIRDGRTRKGLMDLVLDSSPLVRLFAVRGLGKGEPDPEVDSAIARAAEDADDAVATEAAIALARHPSAEGATALVALLDRELVALRRVAVRSMGAMGTWREEVLPALERAWLDSSPTVRAEVAPAFVRLGAEGGPEAVDRALEDRHPLVREKAISAELPEEEALPRIEAAFRDAAPSVAAAAAAALGRIPGNPARELAYAALRKGGGLAKENAAAVLEKWATGEVPPDGDVVTLLDTIEDSPGEDLAEVRATLLEAVEKVEAARRPRGTVLSRTELEENAELLVRLRTVLAAALRDSDPTVRAKAARAWESLVREPLPAGALAPRPRPSPIPGLTAPSFVRPPRVRFRTSRGEFEATLFAEDAPVHVENFLRIARAGRYVGTPFHRVEPNFVVQGGDHLGDGTGAKAAEGGTIRDEINRRRFLAGTIGMPKTDVPDSGGSQIFITLIPTPHLDGRYTAFGQVDSGMEVVSTIEVGDRIEQVVVLDPGR